MSRPLRLLSLAALLPGLSACARPRHDVRVGGPVTAYVNGACFTGRASYTRCTLAVRDGVFVPPETRADSVVDLRGGWITPPLAEAHNHNVEPSARLERVLQEYVRHGVLYVFNPNALPGTPAALAGRVNTTGAPDVLFAAGGFTGPGGHPSQIAQANIARGTWRAQDGEGAFYHTVHDSASVERAWRTIVAQRPSTVKLFLLHSDRYVARLRDSSTIGWRGMDPALVPLVVRRAHAAGVRAAAHVETAADFRMAVQAGVDIVAHLPGFRGNARAELHDATPYVITKADARAAADRGVAVTTTVGGLLSYAAQQRDTLTARVASQLFRENLQRLHTAGVRIAIGSDEYGDTGWREGLSVAALNAVSRHEVLRWWTEVTPQLLFPARRVGRLDAGYEASFVVWRGDPVATIDATPEVRRVVQRGVTVYSPP